MQGGHIDPSNGAETSTPGGPNVSQFKNLSMYDGGLAVTFAGRRWRQCDLGPVQRSVRAEAVWRVELGGVDRRCGIHLGPAIVGGSYYSWDYQGALGLPTHATISDLRSV